MARKRDHSDQPAKAEVAVPSEVVAAALAEIAALRASGKPLSRQRAAALAAATGLSPRTIYRRANSDGDRKADTVKTLTETEQLELALCGGNISEFVRRMQAADPNAPGATTYRERVAATFNAAELAFLRKGDEAMRAKQLYSPYTVAHRNDVWQVDFTVLPIHAVRKAGSSKIVRVVECAIIDCATRRILACLCAEGPAPNSQLALATLALALWRYGTPSLLVTDNGAEFLSNAYTKVGGVYGFDIQPARPYSPHQKARIERFFHTKEQEFLRGLPYYLNGPRDLAGDLYGGERPLTIAAYEEMSKEWVERYNTTRRHSALDGLTPVDAWEQDTTPLRPVKEDGLWWLLPADPQPRSVYGFGVLFNKEKYFALPLVDRVDDRLQVRYLPGERSRIWLVDGGELVCVARPWSEQPPAVIRATINHRDKEQAKMAGLLNKADADEKKEEPATAKLDEETLRQLVAAIEEDRDAAVLADLKRSANEPTKPLPRRRRRYEHLNQPISNPASKSGGVK